MSRRALVAVAFVLACGTPVAAQDEAVLRSFFEGRRVTLAIDMPGTSDGIDVQADSSRALDYRQYGERLKLYGTAIHSRQSATVTLVKIKGDHIEFQLNGGGYGTFADDTSTTVSIPYVEPTSRERELDRLIREEDDSHRRHRLENEREELRERRARQNRRIDAERAVAEAHKRELLDERRRKGGSRFNLRYRGSVPSGIKPEEVMAALAEFVDFSSLGYHPAVPLQPRDDRDAPDDRDVPVVRTVAPHKGMTREEAELAFGRPVSEKEHREGALSVTTLRFVGPEQQVVADFVEDVLVRFSMSSR
jgi:hypothetical protein